MIPADGQVIGSIGCNFGTTEAELVRQGRTVHGVDIDAAAIEVASKRLSSARVIAANERRPFERATLDGLILADVLEHLPNAWLALSSFAECVKPGGWIVISVPNMRSLIPMAHFLIGGDWPEHPVGIFDATHVQVMSAKRIERWCRSAGLEIEQWFDRYPPQRFRAVLFQIFDRITFRLFHSWLMFQLCLRCRVPSKPLQTSVPA